MNYRWSFVKRYLQCEQRMFWWIQITEEEALQLEMQKIVPANCGYTYNHPETGEKMREYHVDTCNLFQERMNA